MLNIVLTKKKNAKYCCIKKKIITIILSTNFLLRNYMLGFCFDKNYMLGLLHQKLIICCVVYFMFREDI